jgi:hypothetical protein
LIIIVAVALAWPKRELVSWVTIVAHHNECTRIRNDAGALVGSRASWHSLVSGGLEAIQTPLNAKKEKQKGEMIASSRRRRNDGEDKE